ncbi:MAG: histidine phosphatase family protein [Desulfobacteraceae bacterium]|nr:histidine phosphatase family protein [Desulfobacteraceae bacterium]
MSSKTRISFVRHGHVHNPDQIIYGRLPFFRLSKKGRKDARKAAVNLKDFTLDAVFSSPLLRARQTAKKILKYHPDLKLLKSNLVTEVSTAFEGMAENQIKAFSDDMYHHKDSEFEQPKDILVRSLKWIHRIRKKFKGRHVAVVSHGDVILFLHFRAKGIDVTPENKLNIPRLNQIQDYPATGSVTTFIFNTQDIKEIPKVACIS